jgi:hypothetical protein
MTNNSRLSALWYENLQGEKIYGKGYNCLSGAQDQRFFPLEAGTGKNSQAGPLTALPFFLLVEPDEDNLVKSYSNYLG